MSELDKGVLARLKKTPCEQENCCSDNQDNVQLIVFGSNKAKKTGLMCSGCYADSELLAAINPVEKFSLPIRKYLSILMNFYNVYAEAKESPEWGPTVVGNQAEELRRRAEIFFSQGLKSTLEIVQYVDSLTKKATEDLRKVYQDPDFDKMVQFINEQNDGEQERMILTNELSHIIERIKIVEGKHRYSTEDKIKKDADDIIINYQKAMQVAVKALKELQQVHKDLLKSLL